MAKVTPQEAHPDLTPQDILDLGQGLLDQDSLETQVEYLKGFLKAHYGGTIEINFNISQKFLPSNLHSVNVPVDLTVNDRGSQLKEDANSHLILIPLLNGAREIGQIILNRDTTFSTTALDHLDAIGLIASLAINATLQTLTQQWQRKQLNLVRSVTTQISQITDLNQLTEQITALVQQTFNYYYVAVFLINEETGRLHFKTSAGADDSDRPDFESHIHPGFELGEHIIGYVAETGEELIAGDVTQEPRYKAVDSLEGTRSEVVLPLRVVNENLGVFDIQSNQLNAFDKDDLLVLRALAENISIAIQSTRLLEDVKQQADHLAAVAEASNAITSILDTDELFQEIVDLIHDRFGYPFVHLYIVDPVQSRIAFKAGSGDRTPAYAKAGIWFDLDAEKGVLAWVVRNGVTKRINSVEKEPLFLETPFSPTNTASEMAVPLSFGENVLGVLDIQSQQKNAFKLEDQILIETFADNIAIAIRNASLYRSERWRRQVAESLRDIAGQLADNAALDSTLQAILVELQRNLPCDIGGIWLYDPEIPSEQPLEERPLQLVASISSADYDPEVISQLTFIPDAWVKNALRQKVPTVRQKNETIGPIAARYGFGQNYSSIAAPLHTGDQILGMLTLIHHTSGRYGEESQKITSAFASYAAIAIENTRLYRISQEQAWISTILLQVAQATQSQTNLSELVQTIVRLTPMVVGIKGCALFLRDAESEIYALYAMHGIAKAGETNNLDQPVPLPNAPLLAELTLSQEPLLVIDPEEDLALPPDLAGQMQGNALILLPLQARNEMLGAFLLADEIGSDDQGNYWAEISDERLNIIQGIVQQTAIAVENIRLLETKQEDAYISTVLLQAAQAAVSSVDLDDTLDSIVHLMPILVGIDSSVIYLFDETGGNFVAAHAALQNAQNEAELIGTSYQPGDFPLLDTVYQTIRPHAHPLVDTLLPAEDWDLALPDEGQIDPSPILQSRYPILMAFPLSIKDDVFGVFIAQDKTSSLNRGRRFELIWGIAQEASLAIQNDRLNKEMMDRQRLDREFQLAREIQQTFLPSQMPTTPGWGMDVRWDPVRQVGGDFYDYFLLPDGRLGFVIADVSNKGLAAALYMTVARTLIRAAALESNSPARALERVNDLLLMNTQNGLFVTTFYGALNLADGFLTYTSAGHNPPLLVRQATQTVDELEKGGIALGVLGVIHLEDRSLQILSGDCLILYTDGVTEAFNLSDQMYGDDRLKTVLQSATGLSAQEVLAIVEADLQIFRGDAPLSDDTTMLALYRETLLTDQDRQPGMS